MLSFPYWLATHIHAHTYIQCTKLQSCIQLKTGKIVCLSLQLFRFFRNWWRYIHVTANVFEYLSHIYVHFQNGFISFCRAFFFWRWFSNIFALIHIVPVKREKKKNEDMYTYYHTTIQPLWIYMFYLSFTTISRLHPAMYVIRYVSVPDSNSTTMSMPFARFETDKKKKKQREREKQKIHAHINWKRAEEKHEEERTKNKVRERAKQNRFIYCLLACSVCVCVHVCCFLI